MLKTARIMAAKDLSLALAGGQGIVQAVLLGLTLIFVFSLSKPIGMLFPPQGAAAVFWLATVFGLVLVMTGLYGLEEHGGARAGLVLSPAPLTGVWLGKTMAGLVLVAVSQVVFFPAAVAFLGQSVQGDWALGMASILAADWGLAVLASLLGALAQGAGAGSGRESMLSVLLFPLLTPVLLAGVKLVAGFLSGQVGYEPGEGLRWLGILLAYDAVFTAAALVLFPYVFSAEE